MYAISSGKDLLDLFNANIKGSEQLKDFDLNEWLKMWIKKEGVSVMTPNWKVDDKGKIVCFEI